MGCEWLWCRFLLLWRICAMMFLGLRRKRRILRKCSQIEVYIYFPFRLLIITRLCIANILSIIYVFLALSFFVSLPLQICLMFCQVKGKLRMVVIHRRMVQRYWCLISFCSLPAFLFPFDWLIKKFMQEKSGMCSLYNSFICSSTLIIFLLIFWSSACLGFIQVWPNSYQLFCNNVFCTVMPGYL